MRIIGGALRGKRLRSLGTYKIRPTADRLRESIFGILSYRVQDAIVLDLFAGTGALGIEALSRGSQFAVFIDNYKSAIFLIEQNIRLCFLEQKAKIIKWDITKNLKCIKSFAPPFNLVSELPWRDWVKGGNRWSWRKSVLRFVPLSRQAV